MTIISNEIEAYNMQLVNTLTKINLQDYTTEFHTKFCSDIDISFMEYFMDLVKYKNKFVVNHENLIEFGVINQNDSSKIKRLLDQLNFEENQDYLLLNVEQQINTTGRGSGFKYAKKYTLTPNAFKICLMRSQNTLKYSHYFTFIEDVSKYYSDYQLELAINEKQLAINEKQLVIKEKELISIDNKELKNQNQTLHQKVDGLVTELQEVKEIVINQSHEINVLTIYAKDTNAKISDLHVLLYKMFALLLTDIYCHDVKHMKALILFVYKKDDKYYLSFTYCQLSLLHIQIKKKFSDVAVVNIIIFKPLKDNVITIQKVLESFSTLYTVNKRTNTIICSKEQKKEVIKKIRVIINELSINSISTSIKKLENLRHEQDIFSKCNEADEKFKLIFQHHTKPYINAIMNNEHCKDDQVEYINDIKNLINDFRKGDLDKYF